MSKPITSRTRQITSNVLYAALTILKELGREAHSSELFDLVEKRVELDNWAKERYAKSGQIRWRTILTFWSIGAVKSGYLIKKKGRWFLTPEGEKALLMKEVDFIQSVYDGYWKWKKSQPIVVNDVVLGESSLEPDEVDISESLDEIESKASDGITRYIDTLNAYEFQDLCAALLRAMGYFTPFIAPRGKDGGIDIVAYRDPLGTSAPRIKVQVKHKIGKATSQELQQLLGILQAGQSVGIFFSSAGFTPDAKQVARTAHTHVELIDIDRLISLWQEFYTKMPDEDKALLPLRSIYFLARE